MYRYYATKTMDINGKNYNPGDIINSETPIEGLEELGKTGKIVEPEPQKKVEKEDWKDQIPKPDKKVSLICAICGKEFRKKRALNKHKKKIHDL